MLEILKKFDSFANADADRLNHLSGNAHIVEHEEGKIIFKRGSGNNSCHWLISGAVDLLDKDFNVNHLDTSSALAATMLDDTEPHELTAITTEPSRFLVVDREALTDAAPAAGSEPDTQQDTEEGIDWMSALLESHLFALVPPSNIQELFNRFEEVKYMQDDKVIEQGEVGDFFYVIQRGSARIDRANNGNVIKLAEVGAGSFFGEDALVREVPRNATITMLTPGILMRLGKDDFQQLLQKPSNEYVTLDEVKEARESGEQKLMILDVRLPKEFKQGSVETAVNIPVQLLHQNLGKLKNGITYICSCDGGHRSELAAYILIKGGFDAYILEQPQST